MKKLAGIILSGCLAAAALGSVTASATTEYYSASGYSGSFTYQYENRYIGISQKRWVSSTTGQVYIESSYLQMKDGAKHYGQGSTGYKATAWVPNNLVKVSQTRFGKISRNGVKSFLCSRTR